MEETQTQPNPTKDNSVLFYILGGVVVTAIVVAGFLLYPRNTAAPAPETSEVQGTQAETVETVVEPTEVPRGPIGSLTCTQQYYNSVNGVAETYFLSVEGEAPTASTSVKCNISALINDKVVASQELTGTSFPAPDRGGFTFRCTTQGLKVTPGVPVKVTADLTDANGTTASCNRMFLLP